MSINFEMNSFWLQSHETKITEKYKINTNHHRNKSLAQHLSNYIDKGEINVCLS